MTKYILDIREDELSESPREWDNLSIITISDRTSFSGLGDETFCSSDFESWNDVYNYLWKEGALVVLPLYLYSHSGIVLSFDKAKFQAIDGYGWDWTQIGFIYTTKEKVNLIGTPETSWLKVFEDEIKNLNLWLSGDIWSFCISEWETSKVLEAVGGFYGRDDAVKEGIETLQSIALEGG